MEVSLDRLLHGEGSTLLPLDTVCKGVPSLHDCVTGFIGGLMLLVIMDDLKLAQRAIGAPLRPPSSKQLAAPMAHHMHRAIRSLHMYHPPCFFQLGPTQRDGCVLSNLSHRNTARVIHDSEPLRSRLMGWLLCLSIRRSVSLWPFAGSSYCDSGRAWARLPTPHRRASR